MENTDFDENISDISNADFFVRDMNGDGNLEIYLLMSSIRTHAGSTNYLISINEDGNPSVNNFLGDKFWGYNSETGIFANEHFGMGVETIEVHRLNKDNTITLLHDIEAIHGNYIYDDEQKANAGKDGKLYSLSIDDEIEYFDNEEMLQNKIDSVMSYYNFTIPATYKFTKENYTIAIEDGKENIINYNSGNITVILNGNKISFDVQPYIENGTTMVPMRAIFEALGAEVNYDAETKTIRASKGDTIIELVTGSSEVVINGERYTLSNTVANKNGSTMVLLRFISEVLGADVDWNGETKTIEIILNTDNI